MMALKSRACWVVLAAVLALPALAQDSAPTADAPEKERRKAAAREERERRKGEEAAARGEARSTETQAESARRAELGLGEDVLPEEERGFFVRLDAFSGALGGADRAVANVGEISTAAVTAEDLDADADGLPDAFTITNRRALRLEHDDVLSLGGEVGWRTGTGAAFSLRYWAGSQDTAIDASSTRTFASGAGGSSAIVGAFDNVGFENDFGAFDTDPDAFLRHFGSPQLVIDNRLHGADSVAARGDVDLTRLDVLFSKVGLARKRLELRYRVGVTFAEAEREDAATITWRSFSRDQVALAATSVETISSSSRADGFGPTAGVGVRWNLTASRRWGVEVGADVAGVFVQHELVFRDAQRFTQDGIDPQDQVFHDVTNAGASRLMTIIDGEVGLSGRFGRRVNLSLGWRASRWMDAATREHFPSPANRALLEQQREDLRLSGPFVRVGFLF